VSSPSSSNVAGPVTFTLNSRPFTFCLFLGCVCGGGKGWFCVCVLCPVLGESGEIGSHGRNLTSPIPSTSVILTTSTHTHTLPLSHTDTDRQTDTHTYLYVYTSIHPQSIRTSPIPSTSVIMTTSPVSSPCRCSSNTETTPGLACRLCLHVCVSVCVVVVVYYVCAGAEGIAFLGDGADHIPTQSWYQYSWSPFTHTLSLSLSLSRTRTQTHTWVMEPIIHTHTHSLYLSHTHKHTPG
jgi:hypothetical protein